MSAGVKDCNEWGNIWRIIVVFDRRAAGILGLSSRILKGGWSFVMTAIILLAIKYTIGLRVSDEEEALGLDATQHGEITYIG